MGQEITITLTGDDAIRYLTFLSAVEPPSAEATYERTPQTAAAQKPVAPAPKRRGRKPKAVTPPPVVEADEIEDAEEPEEVEEFTAEEDDTAEEPEVVEEAPKVKGKTRVGASGATKAISYEELISTLKADREKAKKILGKMGIKSIQDLPETRYGEVVKAMRA